MHRYQQEFGTIQVLESLGICYEERELQFIFGTNFNYIFPFDRYKV